MNRRCCACVNWKGKVRRTPWTLDMCRQIFVILQTNMEAICCPFLLVSRELGKYRVCHIYTTLKVCKSNQHCLAPWQSRKSDTHYGYHLHIWSMNWQREATGVAGRQRAMSLLCLLMAQMSFQHREIAAAEDHLAPFVLSCNSRGCNIGPRGYIMISTLVHHWLFFGWHGFPIDSIMYLLNPLTGVSSVFFPVCFYFIWV